MPIDPNDYTSDFELDIIEDDEHYYNALIHATQEDEEGDDASIEIRSNVDILELIIEDVNNFAEVDLTAREVDLLIHALQTARVKMEDSGRLFPLTTVC